MGEKEGQCYEEERSLWLAEELVEELRRQQEELWELQLDPEQLREVAAAESSGGYCCYSPFVDCCCCCCWQQKALQCPGKVAATAAGYFPLSMMCSS